MHFYQKCTGTLVSLNLKFCAVGCSCGFHTILKNLQHFKLIKSLSELSIIINLYLHNNRFFFPLKVFVIQKQHHLVENGVWDPKTEGLITLYLLTQQGPCWNRTCSFFIIQKSYDNVLRFWRLRMKTEPLCLQFMSMD